MNRSALAGALLVALVAGGLFGFGLGSYPLLDPDEARHAEVAREMASGRGIRRLFLPTLALEPYHEKPAGFYWLVAVAFGLGGVGAGAARAVSALAALATVLAVYGFAVPRFGVPAACSAALVLATTVGWFGLARLSTLDMTLTALVAGGVLAGLAWLDRPAPRRAPLAPYVLAGLGTLVKGPLALALVAGPLLLAGAVRRPRPSPRELGIVRGALVTAAIAALLYVPVGLLDATYLRDFLWTNVRRLGGKAPHAAPVWYYAVSLPVMLLPWTPLWFATIGRAARDPARRALLLWAIFVPAFLSLARGKLATYALSALPPLALLAGPELVDLTRRGAGNRWALPARWTTAVLVAGIAVAVPIAGRHFPISAAAQALLVVVALAAAAAIAFAGVRWLPAAVLGATLALYPLAIHLLVPPVASVRSDFRFAQLVAAADGDAPVVAFASQAPSLVFYLRRPVLMTDDPKLVRDLFADDHPVFVVTGGGHAATLEQALGERAYQWDGTPRRRLYANRPPPK